MSIRGTFKDNARDQDVKRLLDEGLSRSLIAARLGLTPNKVHGIVYRRGWAERRRPVEPPPAAALGPPSPVTAVPNYKRGSTNGLALTQRRRAAAKQAAAPPPVEAAAAPEPLHCLTPFHELRLGQCRFIPGEPVWDAPACGRRVLQPGVSFCGPHAGLVYAGAPPARPRGVTPAERRKGVE